MWKELYRDAPTSRNKEPKIIIGREIRPNEEITLYRKEQGILRKKITHEIKAKVVDGTTVYVSNNQYDVPKLRSGSFKKACKLPPSSDNKNEFGFSTYQAEDVWIEYPNGFRYGLAYYPDDHDKDPKIEHDLEILA